MPLRTRAYLIRCCVTIALTLGFALCFEFYLRRTATFVESKQRAVKDIESDPNLLYDYRADGRWLLPDRDVVVHKHPISGMDVPIRTNSLGFRAEEFPADKPADEKRILVLGDSITIQDYLPDEQTFLKRIQAKLDPSTPPKIRVINAGAGDNGLKEEIANLEQRGLGVRPDAIVVNFYLNDSRPPWGFPGEMGSKGWWRRNSFLINAIYFKLTLWRWVSEQGADRFEWINAQDRLNWRENAADFAKLRELARYDWGAAWIDSEWAALRAQLARLKQLAEERSLPVLIVVFPVSFQVYSSVADDRPQERIKEVAAQDGFEFFDLLPVLKVKNNKELFYDQCHPNAVGSSIVADALLPQFSNILVTRK